MVPRTPDDVLEEIVLLRRELMRAPDVLQETELAAERAADAGKLAEDRIFMQAEGSIPERQARARAASVAERDAGFIAKAAYNRVRAKTKTLEVALMTLQSELRYIREETQ